MNRRLALCLALLLARPASAADPTPADALPRIKLEKVVKLDKPIEVRHDPAGRLFMVEQTGRVLLFEGGKTAEPAYLDLSDKVYVAFECGLLGIAFHPRFEENGLVYASYTTGTALPATTQPATRPATRPATQPATLAKKAKGKAKAKKPSVAVRSYVTEFKADPTGRTVDRGTERVVLTLDQPFDNHNGGQIQFGPDGMLYVGFGDGGSGHDPMSNGQNPNTWLGKILRIDVTPPAAANGSRGDGYAVPTDNPFVGRDGWKPEIWALGQRNPWRFSFDRQTGLLYAADVGQDVWEEVNIIAKGGNYGWRTREGAHDLHPETTPTTTPLIDPIYAYNHDMKAASITGGYVYRGTKYPSLQGWYLFGEYSLGKIFGLKYDGSTVVAAGTLVDPQGEGRTGGQRPTQPSGFGEDKDGELYMTDINGWVYRVVGE